VSKEQKAPLVSNRLITFLPYQRESLTCPYRLYADEWSRQTGKTFKGSSWALLECMSRRHNFVTTLSASLRQGALVIRKDAEVWRSVIDKYRELVASNDKQLRTNADDDKGNLLDIDAISDLLETGKLEAKVWWGRTAGDYSSHQIFAANPDTVRGATGSVFWDEAFLTAEFRECLRAARSIIARRQDARFILASSPPISSSHESWDILYHESKFPVSPKGNWRQAKAKKDEYGMWILRVDGYDAEAAGIKWYDEETGTPISVAEARARNDDKDGFDREALLLYKSSGVDAIPYHLLVQAQTRGADDGVAFDLGSVTDLDNLSVDGLTAALLSLLPPSWADPILPSAEIGIGHDQATSDGKDSNPSSITVTEKDGLIRKTRLVVRWKSRSPGVNEAILLRVIMDLIRRGIRPRGLAIDASNETFNALRLRSAFSHLVPVELIKSGESWVDPATGTKMLWKQRLGDNYVESFLNGCHWLPSGDWLVADHSLATKGPSGYDNRTSKGNHGDTFDSGKLAEEMLRQSRCSTAIEGVSAGTLTASAPNDDDDDSTQTPNQTPILS